MVDTPPTTSATTIVPRMPLTAFGVLISTTSPGRIRDLSTATEMRPETRSIVDTPGTSVIVITERSRAVTIALPPSSIRANPLSPVVTRSFSRTSSLNFRGAGDVASCVMVTGPTTVVATPTRSCADATAGIAIVRASSMPSTRAIVVFIGAPRLIEAFDIEPARVHRGCQGVVPRYVSIFGRVSGPQAVGEGAGGRGSAAPRPTVPPGQALCPTARARRAAPDPPLSTRPHSAIVSGHMPRLGLVPVLLLLALWGCASALPAPPQQRVVLKTSISTRHYPVRGMTTAAIFDHIDRNGLFEKGGQRVNGLTSAEWTMTSEGIDARDRKSTRLNSSHGYISYAVFCLKKKKKKNKIRQSNI